MEERQTIFAQITPPGVSAIAVVRISGSRTAEILNHICGIEKPEHHHIYIRKLIHDKQYIDRAVVSFFQAPDSYTGEDVAEISVHGGLASVNLLKQSLIALGLKQAEKGEFTKRGYLNNKMDLLQAESVLSIINARTKEMHALGLTINEGSLSENLIELKNFIMELKIHIDGSLDFPDDIEYDIKFVDEILSRISDKTHLIADNANKGVLMSNGLKVLLTGQSNCGKSTIFNKMIQEDRAIITDEPGTTRDILTEWINIEGLPVLLMDSAGIREAEHKAEKMGIKKAFDMYNDADIIIMIYDLSKGFTEKDKQIMNDISAYNYILIGNKRDLSDNENCPENTICISALKDNDMADIINRSIIEHIDMAFSSGKALVINEREADTVLQIKHIADSIDKKVILHEPEKLSEICSNMIDLIGNLFGHITDTDILNIIFDKFCIGK